MTGSFYQQQPSNPQYDPRQNAFARSTHGVPTGTPRQRDQVIVDIPRHYDPQFAPASQADHADIDATLARSDAYGYDHAAPYDPEAYASAHARAAADGGDGGWQQPPSQSQQSGTDPEDVESIVDLTDDERADLSDFFSVGKRRGTVKVLGHIVHCQTLNALDEMNIGRYVAPYTGTPGFVRAWTTATAAAGIRLINGRRIYDSLAPTEDEAELFDEKVRLVARAFPYAITPVYDRIQELDAEFSAIAERISSGKMFG